MPYSIKLRSYVLPEFEREAPEGWVRRLREFSPVTDLTDHLVFRWMEPHPSWPFHERGLWLLYRAVPRHLVTPDRALMFARHWSELPLEEQPGRKALVSDYQHFMWHSRGVDVFPYWICMGEVGGVPAVFTRYEQRALDGLNLPSEPPPIGSLPGCPFDERTVTAIQRRDRLFANGNDFDALRAADRPDALKASDEAAEHKHRVNFLDFWFEQIQPQAEFLKSYLSKSESDMTLRKATKEEHNLVTEWKDHWLEHGHVLSAGVASSTKPSILVPASLT